MRKHILTTVAVAAAICLAGCSKKALVSGIPNTFTDTRDGQKYKTVKIGNQVWMAENLNYQTERGSWCYKNHTDSCAKYGRLYDWNTAKTVSPAGWKLPDRDDWRKLVSTAGGLEIAGKKLKSKSGWNNRGDGSSGNGTDDFGFSALPGVNRDSDGSFYDAGSNGFWWTATECRNRDFAYYWRVHYSSEYGYEDNYYKSDGFSVRCVKN